MPQEVEEWLVTGVWVEVICLVNFVPPADYTTSHKTYPETVIMQHQISPISN